MNNASFWQEMFEGTARGAPSVVFDNLYGN
jgi:hypothetical protein